jgi:hypothetical protein
MHITTIDGVFDALGGYNAVGCLVGGVRHRPLMWRERGNLPPRSYVVLTRALKRRGHTAAPALWGMWEAQHKPGGQNGKARK